MNSVEKLDIHMLKDEDGLSPLEYITKLTQNGLKS